MVRRGIGAGVLVPARELADPDREARLLAHFADDRVDERFAELDATAGWCPLAGTRSPPPLHEQEATVVHDDRADGDFGMRGVRHASAGGSGLCISSAAR